MSETRLLVYCLDRLCLGLGLLTLQEGKLGCFFDVSADDISDVVRHADMLLIDVRNPSIGREELCPSKVIEDIAQKLITSQLKAVGGERAAFTDVISKMVTGDLSYMAQKEYGNVLALLTMDAELLQTASGVGKRAVNRLHLIHGVVGVVYAGIMPVIC